MKTGFSFFLVCLLGLTIITSMETCQMQTGSGDNVVKFVITSDSVPNDSAVFLVGNALQMGMWIPSRIEMTRVNENTWEHEISLASKFRAEYKFTLGTWETQALSEKGNIYPNFMAYITSDTVIHHSIPQWQSGKPEPTIQGKAELWENIGADGLRSRDVVIWLPQDYDSTDQHYPVLYMHDGQNIIDKSTSAIGVEWEIDETVTNLVENDEIQPMIVVGIYNTEDRSDEYSEGNKAERYMDFLCKELKPLIDESFRTLPERENTWTGGASMGGLISFCLLWERNDCFSKALCFSPAFAYKDFDYVSNLDTANLPGIQPHDLYLFMGGKGVDVELDPAMDRMTTRLDALNIPYEVNKNAQADHNEKAWAEEFPMAIKFLAGKKDS